VKLTIPSIVKEELTIDGRSPSNLVWRVNKGPRAQKGSSAGCLNKKTGYYYVRIDNKLYLAHRLIWYIFYGEDPGEFQIDHVDRNRTNNDIENLRKATQTQQNQNSSKKKNNKSGYKGVRRHTKGKWHAYIKINEKQVSLGYYDKREEAANAYNEAAKKYFGEFASLNVIQHTHFRFPERNPNQLD